MIHATAAPRGTCRQGFDPGDGGSLVSVQGVPESGRDSSINGLAQASASSSSSSIISDSPQIRCSPYM